MRGSSKKTMEIGATWNESQLYRDALTARTLRRLTTRGRINQTPTYHTNSGFTADGACLVFASVRQGATWIIVAEVESGQLTALWRAPGVGDRNYIHRGMSLCSADVDGYGICGNRVSVAPKSRAVVFTVDRRLMAVDIDTYQARVLMDDCGDEWIFGAPCVSPDERYVAIALSTMPQGHRSPKEESMSTSHSSIQHPSWTPTPIQTSWDDLLEGIDSPEAWEKKRPSVKRRFLELIRDQATPEPPGDPLVDVEEEWNEGDFRIQSIRYQVEADERARAYVAIPNLAMPRDGFPGVVCLHGTLNWGARRTLGLPPEPGDPHADRASVEGKDYARQLARRGYLTISPEHFCAATRMPEEGPFDTAAFYRKHPNWSAVGKYMYDSRIACSLLAARPDVNAARLGATGHSLGGHGSIWLAAYDDRIRCAAPSCSGPTFRENPEPLHWSRDYWYVYFPQLRDDFLSGRRVQCDFHEMMALIAPRPLLERFALNDGDPRGQAHRVMLHLKVHELYRLLGREPAHAFLLFGDGHAIPDVSRASMLSWMDRWLKYDGDPLAAWDAHPTPRA